MKRAALAPAYRRQVALRTLAAVVGAFALASAASILLAVVATRTGLASRASAVHGATLLGFVLWCGAVMWAYTPARVARVWQGLLGGAALCAALAGLIGWGAV